MKIIRTIILISFILSLGLVFLKSEEIKAEEYIEENYEVHEKNTETKYIKGRVIEIIEEKDIEIEGKIQTYQKLRILIPELDKEVIVENGNYLVAQVVTYDKYDEVVLSYSQDLDGNEIFYVTDHVRTNPLLFLFIVFIVLAVLIGGKKGFYSIIAMMISFIILFLFVLPAIQKGNDPVIVVLFASIFIVPITFYLSHGIEKKTTVAIISTFIALMITGILSSLTLEMTYLTGMASEESIFLQTMSSGVEYNLKGILLAGIIIGTLGVLDDITVSQTAIVYQLKDLKKDIGTNELFKRSLKIGKDHISSMINTLILVYTGASMPLLLLFLNNPTPIDQLVNMEMISTEIVRTLVGSIGLILAVPISTYLACYFVRNKD